MPVPATYRQGRYGDRVSEYYYYYYYYSCYYYYYYYYYLRTDVDA